MDTHLLQQTIGVAKAHELETGQLTQLLEARISDLHRAIQLPANNSVPALLNFIIRYIEHVPEFIEAVVDIADEAGIRDTIEPVIEVACGFFLEPPQWLEQEAGLVALMDQAYLAHRLIEEVNDRYMGNFGAPLVPMDMTRSNLIIHHLIGESFANRLDSQIHAAVNRIVRRDQGRSKPSIFTDRCRSRNTARELTRWPCLNDTLSINLMLDGQSSQITLH